MSKSVSVKSRYSASRFYLLTIATITLCIVLPFLVQLASGGTQAQATVPTLTANLVAPPVPNTMPFGNAFYGPTNAADRILRVNVNGVSPQNSPRVFLNNTDIGAITFAAGTGGGGVLFLTTANGGNVPFVVAGDAIAVRIGSTILLSGVFGPPASPTTTPTLSPTPTPSPTGSPVPVTQLWASLTGPPIGGITPRGVAQYQSANFIRFLNVFVSYVNLPENTSLSVTINGAAVGNIVIRNRQGQYTCGNAANPTPCPIVANGAAITVRNGNATILSGTFTNTPPTGSPTPTPSVTPTPPTPGPLNFRANLTGSSVVPPVTTQGTGFGMVKLVPSSTANSALRIAVSLSYRNLSSNVTAVTINGPAMAGVNAPVIFTLANNPNPTPGTTSLRFFNINAEQLAQLRTGLWYFNVATVNNPGGEIRGQILSQNMRTDFDGDGISDIAVMRAADGLAPDNAAFVWYLLNSGDNTVSIRSIGRTGDINVQGDYDGDGVADIAMYTPGDGTWQIRGSETGETRFYQWGTRGDIPVVGDYDGDGLNDLAVFRPSQGMWYVTNSSNGSMVFTRWGLAGDRPVSGDFDGDGRNDLAVFRPSNGLWYISLSSGGAKIMQWGLGTDLPVSGDFDGDGSSDIAVFRPSQGVWYIFRSSTNQFTALQFGLNGDIPVPCEFDGDGITDIAVFRPSDGNWYIRRSTDQVMAVHRFGLATDHPVATVYAP